MPVNELLDLREKLQDTHAAMSRLKDAFAADPNDLGLALMLESLEARQDRLESTFRELANLQLLEICSYRLIKEQDDEFPIVALGDTLKNFQSWLTTVFDAIRTGPKEKAHPSAETVQQTTLDFGYTFAGSLGFVFTIPNERLLLGESELDQAIEAMFRMVHSTEQKELAEFAHAFGISAIRRMYDWANTHARYVVSADIKWKRREEIRQEVLLQAPQALNLCKLIDSSSEVEADVVEVLGELKGVDTAMGTFHLQFPNSPDIRGKMASSFSYSGDLTVDRIYKAKLLQQRTLHYATDKEDITHELLEITAAL